MKVKAGQDIEERAVILGRYILEHKAAVRAAAKQFGISHCTDIVSRLKQALSAKIIYRKI